ARVRRFCRYRPVSSDWVTTLGFLLVIPPSSVYMYVVIAQVCSNYHPGGTRMNAPDPAGRTATIADPNTGQVVLMNRFVVPEGRDDAFLALWTETSEYFRAQPGFVSLKLHRAVSADAEHRYV